MLKDFLTLDISPDASDEQIREAYLHLIKKHPPEKDPVNFQRINSAYEAVKDKRSRVRTRIFFSATVKDPEQSLLELAKSRKIRRKSAGLKKLIKACHEVQKDFKGSM